VHQGHGWVYSLLSGTQDIPEDKQNQNSKKYCNDNFHKLFRLRLRVEVEENLLFEALAKV